MQIESHLVAVTLWYVVIDDKQAFSGTAVIFKRKLSFCIFIRFPWYVSIIYNGNIVDGFRCNHSTAPRAIIFHLPPREHSREILLKKCQLATMEEKRSDCKNAIRLSKEKND